jgi:hypothetical protein
VPKYRHENQRAKKKRLTVEHSSVSSADWPSLRAMHSYFLRREGEDLGLPA